TDMSKFKAYKNVDENYVVPEKMQAAVLSGPGYNNFKIEEVKVPSPGPGQLLARVDATTLCVSMHKPITQGPENSYFYGWDPARNPLILGDEGSVTIVKVGNNLKNSYKVGQRYTIQPPVRCAPINNRQNYSNNGRGIERLAMGYTLGGFYSKYVLILEEIINNEAMVSLPDNGMPYFAVSLAEPMSTIVRSHHLHLREYQDSPSSPWKIKPGLKEGGTTIIIGQGPMGRLHDEFALRVKIKNLVMVEVDKKRLYWGKDNIDPRAREKGISTYYINPAEEDLFSRIKEITDGKMADDVLIPVGNARVQEEAIKLAGRGGRVNLFGGTKGAKIEVDPVFFHYNEGEIVGSSGAEVYDMMQAIDAIFRGDIDPGLHTALIGRFPDIPELLEKAVNGGFDGKVVIYPHLALDKAVETGGKWDRQKEENLFESCLPG
ncbi:MAG: zinc-binding dehydrogenase, partial [Actinobacteria bacterium]|nr:zinc-binding dehydrogenase [Actinomycetota bacterium]